MSNKLFFSPILFLLAVSSSLFGGSMTLINDSVFPLTANIYNAQGIEVGSVSLRAGQTHIWYGSEQDSFSETANSAYTPYTVRWMCNTSRPYDYSVPKKNQKKKERDKVPEYASEFGSWSGVPTGATITALGSPSGNKTCVVKKNQQVGKKPYSPSSKKHRNDGENAWSNDGGQTWTNDGGDSSDQNDDSVWSNDGGPGWTQDSQDEFENDGGENWSND